MIEIVKVESKKQIKEFIEFPLNLYKGNPYFVPPLYGDEKSMFKKDYHYRETCDYACYLAYLDGKVVGRIQAILQKSSNEKWKQKRVRFTRFDSIDNQEVANALFNAVIDFAKQYDMEEIVGPLGFSDLEREGLLIEGFEELSTFEEQYNYPYYQKLIENLGFTKEIDWVERQLRAPKEFDDRVIRVSNLMLKRYNLHFAKCKSIREFLKKYADGFFDIIDITYEHIYGSVPFTEKMKKNLLKSFSILLNLNYVSVILDENEKIVCFGLCLPSIAKAVQKSNGKLTIPTILKILKAKRNPEIIDLSLIGVLPEYAQKGVSSAFIGEIMAMLNNGKIKYAETNLNLEDNLAIQNQWKHFDARLHKRRRSFIKKIEN